LKKVNALAIRLDGGTQVRTELNLDKVKEYAELMKHGTVFPPIVVYHDGTDYWLSSGFHRFFAQKMLDNTAIDCDVRQGTLEDARLFARKDNNHGIPLTKAELKANAMWFFTHPVYGKWSATQIAAEMQHPYSTIARWRNEMDQKPEQVTTIRHGKEVTVKNKQTIKKENPVKEKSSVEKTTFSHENVEDLEEDKFKELTHTIEDLDRQLTAAKDVIASKRWDATEFEQEDLLDTVQQLREEIKIKDMEIATLKDSRDMFQKRNAELIRQVNSLKKKIGI